jgi:hypothetical protein
VLDPVAADQGIEVGHDGVDHPLQPGLEVLDQGLPAAVGAGQVGVVEADDPHLGDVEGERVLPLVDDQGHRQPGRVPHRQLVEHVRVAAGQVGHGRAGVQQVVDDLPGDPPRGGQLSVNSTRTPPR